MSARGLAGQQNPTRNRGGRALRDPHLRFRMFFGSFSGHGAANRLSFLSGATLRLGHRHAVHPIKTGREVMASPDVRTALDVQPIVFEAISSVRDSHHGRLRRPAGRRLMPRPGRAVRRMECYQPGW